MIQRRSAPYFFRENNKDHQNITPLHNQVNGANRASYKVKSGKFTELKAIENRNLPCKLSGKVQERFLKVVIALSRNLIVLEIFLPVKGDLLCFHLPILYIHLVSAQNNWDVLTYPGTNKERHSEDH